MSQNSGTALVRLCDERCGTSFLKSSLPAAASVPAAEADSRRYRSASHQIATSSGRISHLQHINTSLPRARPAFALDVHTSSP